MEVRILHIEDSQADAWMLRRTLQTDGWEVEASVVSSLRELLRKIDDRWDVVLADFGLPGFSTADALELVRQRQPDLPFVIVSGQIGEENAVALMKAGADDYVSKDHPHRLSPVLRRLVQARKSEIEQRIQRQRTQELEDRFRQFFHHNLSGMAMVTPDGEIREINQALLDLLGLEGTALPPFWSLFASVEQAAKIQNQVPAGEAFGPEVVEFLKSDGTHAFLLATFQLRGAASLIWANFIDHTEEVRLQDQIFQIKKLEGLGHLAAGIAHEFNNVLAIIQGQFALLSRSLPNDESIGRRVRVIDHAVARGASTVRQLLVLARRRPVKKEFILIEELLTETCKLVQSLFPENITLRVDVPPGLPGIVGDRDQLGQAFLNLMINAKDSMPGGGAVGVAARLDLRDSPSTFVQIEVSDEGTGIPPDLLDKIFDPFFTTKEEGKGTGLGLSLVDTVARSHRGRIEVKARSPKGTSFSFFVPAASALEAQAATPALQTPQHHGEGASILLVENEAGVRGFEQQVLTDHGFKVTECPSADVAWELLEKDPSAFSVAITDLGMPGLGGEGFCERAQKLQGGPKLIVQTGNMDPAVLERLTTIGVHQILFKPFSPEELLASVHLVLDNEPDKGAE